MLHSPPVPMRLSCLHPFLLALVFAAALSFTERLVAAALCGARGSGGGTQLQPYVAGNGQLSQNSLVLFQNTGIAVSWTGSDSTSAAAYVERMVSNDARDAATAVYLLSISLGDPDDRKDSLLRAIEIWQALGGNGADEILIEDDRYPGDRPGRRGDSDTDREIALNWIDSNPSLNAYPAYGSGAPATAVPEPSAALLTGLGILSLLHRRRDL